MSLPPPPQRSRGSLPDLVDDAMREILLRVPADDPKSLVRAAAVCTSWRGILSDDAFACQYRAFHGAPPMLGFLRTKSFLNYVRSSPSERSWGERGSRYYYSVTDFVSTASFRPPACHERRDWHALDSRHGLVLFHTPKGDEDFVIYDLVTYHQWRIKANDECSNILSSYDDDDEEIVGITWNATVLCSKDRCDHLYCHGGPFLVAFVGCHEERGITFASIYSSETRKWSDIISIEKADGIEMSGSSALVGNKIYFSSANIHSIVEYDMREKELSLIDVPFAKHDEVLPYALLVGVEDGMLLFAKVLDPGLCLWSVEADSNGALALARHRVIELEPLLPTYALLGVVVVVGFAEGVGVIFLSTEAGLYTVDLNSGQSKKVHIDTFPQRVVPYMSFYTRAVSWNSH
uniref:Uncharacterized protein n=1 Tax=Avena sativa TaxID=4498 RepID=A0ACD5WR25_AVESA